MKAIHQVMLLLGALKISCGLALDLTQDYINKIASLNVDNLKEADLKKMADDILSSPLNDLGINMLDPLMMDNPDLYHDLKKIEEEGVHPLEKQEAPPVIPLQSDARRANAAALENEISVNKIPEPSDTRSFYNNMVSTSQPNDATTKPSAEMDYLLSKFKQYPPGIYDASNFRRSYGSETEQPQEPSKPCCLPYTYNNPYLEQFLQPPQPFIVPLNIFYEKVKHDHPSPQEIKDIIKRDKKDFRNFKRRKQTRSYETVEWDRSSVDSSYSSDYSESSAAIDYHEDFIPIKGKLSSKFY